MIKVLLSIRSLDIGGAEKQFIELVKHIDKSKFDVTVCTMYGGLQEKKVKNIPHIRYVNLEKIGRYDFYKFYKSYSKVLKEINPDVIYSFLGEMNLFSLWAKPKHTKIIWGFRSSDKDWSQYGKVAQIVFKLQKFFSAKVDKIISNSHASIEYHKAHGFEMQNSMVISNGIDSNKFKRDEHQRELFRNKYNLNKHDIAIGIVARVDPIKGYKIFAEVGKKICEEYDNIYFFSVGGGSETIQKECELILKEFNANRFFWLGNQKSVEHIYSGFDISISASFGEGFSNTIAEAMSSSLPCVVTDVGDSALIVGAFGVVVEAKSVASLYNGVLEMIDKEYKSLGEESRKRVVGNFSILKMVKNTEKEILSCVE
jgi:glycosyltransferase involved in cell wall biosynthesis